MSKFIQGDNFDAPGGKAEELVWKQVKESFKNREVIGYSKYPFFRKQGSKRREPDILLFDLLEGLIVFEIKGMFCDDIERVTPNQWIMKDWYEKIINPIGQVEDYVFSIKSKLESERMLRGKISSRGIVVLPYITSFEWEERGFSKVTKNFPILFKDDLRKTEFLNRIFLFESEYGSSHLDEESYRLGLAVLGYEDIYQEEKEEDIYISPKTKADIFKKLRQQLYELDQQQEAIGKTIPPGPQRIRGIAGSGKTLLLCQKAAYMHLKNPDWKIAYIFATQSLYDIVTRTIDMYLRAFSGGEVVYKEGGNLQVLHAWGRKDKAGFYREIAIRHNIHPLNVNDVKKQLNRSYVPLSKSINYICKQLLDVCHGNVEQMYDVILIDEGQDLISSAALMYQGKHPFYYLAYCTLKPHRVEEKYIKRLIWAYDELQNLDSTIIPSWKAIIGDDDSMGGGPTYKGGVKKSDVMRKCYRVPGEVLSIAHGLGMGWFRKDGMLTGYTQKKHWEGIGYQVIAGDFRKTESDIIIKRDKRYSVNPAKDLYSGSLFKFQIYNSKHTLLESLAKSVQDDINVQGLKPERDLLIIDLNNKSNLQEVGRYLNKYNVNYYIPSNISLNSNDTSNKAPEVFWMDGGVTISKVMRAKGNEAPMVYVIGLEEIAQKEDRPEERNKLFVALTRTKCFVTLMGVGEWSLYDEVKIAIESKGQFKIKYRKPSRIVDDLDLGIYEE
ncbi:ATP-binding domain-containing protein [Turicibacter bilis]|uniref:ATP-binding domain-containing protein n=1 Tax=Turicibacter bilis TaxID=2735723 RepID=A0A9Q9CJF7_9FIRM|nr:ATP-binding domain-containing protein [Turicibacter bilis]MBS3198476.1 ATP-binding domain-containing protein [Turicibacter bilis]UUF08131.1 ATP-binding domain-containing protein [Turicibacter bilis]